MVRTFSVAFVGFLMVQAAASAQPTTVYVYNHSPTDNFDNNAEAFIFSQLGLLDANGSPINPIPEAQIIRDGNNMIIGYRSADGTQAAYNVNSSATTDQAWMAVANGGTLHIIKHGAKYIDAGPGAPPAGCGNSMIAPPETCDPPGTQGACMPGESCGPHCRCCGNGMLEPGETCDQMCPPGNTCNNCRCEGRGGGIRLDGGNLYDGFGTGTGVGFAGAYPLTPRPGESVNIHLNSCWSSNDPDGPGPERPVTGSAGDVDGVGTATGNATAIYTHCMVAINGGTPAQQAAALDALRAAARAAGFPPAPAGGGAQPPTTNGDIAAWICSLPFMTRYATAQGIINDAIDPDNAVQLNLTYAKNATPTPGGAIGGQAASCESMTQFQPASFEEFPLFYSQYPAAQLTLDPTTLSGPAVLLHNQLGELPAPAPPGLQLVSGMFSFENLGFGQIQTFAIVNFAFHSGDPSMIQVLWYTPDTNQWLPPPGGVFVSPMGNTIQVQTQQFGTFAAFAPQVIQFNQPQAATGQIGCPKNRYISFVPNQGATPCAFRVDKTTAPAGTGYVGAPDMNGISKIVAAPVVRVWNEPVIHSGDCEIVPKAVYEIRATDGMSGASLPLIVPTIVKPGTKEWADTVGSFQDGEWTCPNELVNANDFVAALQKFQDLPTAPHVSLVDVGTVSATDPCVNKLGSFGDVFLIIKGFQGENYGATTDPSACPPCP